MNTGSQDERKYLNDVARIAKATERIASALEELAWPKGRPADLAATRLRAQQEAPE